MRSLSTFAAGLVALAVASSPALATSARTFVSGGGTDTGACTTTDPCRTFAYALTQTEASGEIIVLGSGGYGTVTIAQSVSIINTSNFAGVTVNGGNAITINAGAGDLVTLRGLTLDGGGTVGNGIQFNTGAALIVDQSNVMNFAGFCPMTACVGHGIFIQPASGNHNIVITNTTLSNNSQMGVFYYPPSGSTATTGIVIDRVIAINNVQAGIYIDNHNSSGTAKASISNTNASTNGNGIYTYSATTVSVDASSASNNGGDGIYLGAGTIDLGRSALMNNGIHGLEISGGTVNSYKDNRIAGNGSGDVLGTPATATLY